MKEREESWFGCGPGSRILVIAEVQSVKKEIRIRPLSGKCVAATSLAISLACLAAAASASISAS